MKCIQRNASALKQVSYFRTPHGESIACVGKCASSAIARAIIETHYPSVMHLQALNWFRRHPDSPGWQRFVPLIQAPISPMVLVRDPIERFRSACAQLQLSNRVDFVLDCLENEKHPLRHNFHFRTTARYVRDGSQTMRFPEDLPKVIERLQVCKLTVTNPSSKNMDKPDLTPQQTERVVAYYAADVSLYLHTMQISEVA